MIRLIADEDFHGAITRGLLRRDVDVERVQDIGLRGAPDQRILEWAAEAGRVLLTHDRATVVGAAYDLVRAGRPMCDVVIAAQSLSIGSAIDDLELIASCSELEEWRDRVEYLPLG